MKKEPMTIHITPLLKFALAEKSDKENFKNVNTYVNDILTSHIKEQQAKDKILTELEDIKEQVLVLTQMFEILLNK